MKIAYPLLLAWMLFILPEHIQAQRYNITGRVADAQTLNPIAQLSVIDRISGTGTITTSHGYYSLFLNQGNVELEFKAISYETHNISMELVKDTTIDLTLNPTIMDRGRRLRKDQDQTADLGTSKSKNK
jgi:hypothetical protein